MAGAAEDGQPTLASLVLEAAKKEREKGNIGQDDGKPGDGQASGGGDGGQASSANDTGGRGGEGKKDFASLAAGMKQSPSRKGSAVGTRRSADSSRAGTGDTARNKYAKGGRRQSATPYTSLSDEHDGDEAKGDEAINPQVGGGVMGRTLGKLAEVAGVREAQANASTDQVADNDALRAAKEADEAGILRGPFSINDSKRGQKKASTSSTQPDGGETKGKGKKTLPRSESTQQGMGAQQGEQQGDEANQQSEESDKEKADGKTAGQKGWSTLRAKLGAGTSKPKDKEGLSKALSGHELTTELTTGLLPMCVRSTRSKTSMVLTAATQHHAQDVDGS